MKGYNGVATLSRRELELVRHGLCEGADSEDVRILETVVAGIPIANTYVPQGHKVGTDNTFSSWNGFTVCGAISRSTSTPGVIRAPFTWAV